MPPYPGFINGSMTSRSPFASQERTVNFYPEKVQTPFGKTEWVLYPTPGVAVFATHPTQTRVRAMFEENGRAFAVIGNQFCEILPNGTIIDRGAVAEPIGGEPASITSNGDGGQHLFICAAGKGYAYDLLADTLTEVLVDGAARADSLDGFIVVLDDRDSTLQSSEHFDATDFRPSAIEQRQSGPDPWVSMIVHRRNLYAIGERTTDVYYNAGLTPFPFALHAAGAIPYGTAAKDSVALVGDALMWLGRSREGIGQVVLATGSGSRDVASHALRYAIAGYHEAHGIADAVGTSYESEGHLFYVLTFPAADASWAFDLATGVWTERLTWNADEGRYQAWRPHWNCVAFGRTLIGDRTTGAVYTLSNDAPHDANGQPIRRLRRAPCLFNENKRVNIKSFELVLETGIGRLDPTAQGHDPQVVLHFSRDGGKTFQQAAGTPSAGKRGDFRVRVDWPRLGTARDHVFEVVFSDPVPWNIMGAFIEVRPGAGT